MTMENVYSTPKVEVIETFITNSVLEDSAASGGGYTGGNEFGGED